MSTMGVVPPRPVRRTLVVLGLVGTAVLAVGVGQADPRSGGEHAAGAATRWERIGPQTAECVICHATPEILDVEADPDLYVEPAVITASVHPDLSCQDCHGTLEANLTAHPRMLLGRAEASCGNCHRAPARLLEEGAHGSGPSGLVAPANAAPSARPTCVSCHGSHDVLSVESSTFAGEAAQRCSDCHVERGESFFDRNYHGKETRLGRFDVAVCSDCHGAHSVLPASDPRSPVNPANVVETCRQCHPAAPENFADIIIHVGGRPLPNDPRLMGATLAMMVILVVTFGFFGAHTALAIRHELRSRRRRGGE